MKSARETVRKTIIEHSLVQRGDMLVLGLSGGPDSMCLLDILMDLRHEMGFDVCALHFNHSIRGAEADADEEFLKEYCSQKGIRLVVKRADVPGIAKANGESEEACGRRLRHAALFELAASEQQKLNDECFAHVVLAHNADDQAETVLLRIIRGTGTHGLSAMQYLREDGLIRPLLDTDRSAVELYCEQKGLNPRIDSTNLSADYTRNKVRLEIMPKLREINPNINAALIRLAANAKEDDMYIEYQAWEFAQSRKGSVLSSKELRDLFPAEAERVIKIKFEEIGLAADIASVHVNALLDALYTNVGNKTIEFPKGYTAYLNRGKVFFRRPGEKNL